MVPFPACKHIAKFLQDESDRGLISCIGKFFKPLDNIRRVASLARNSSLTSTWLFFLSFKLLLALCTVSYKLSMSFMLIMLNIFDVSIEEKRVYGSLCF